MGSGNAERKKKKQALAGWVLEDLRGHNGISLHLTVSLFSLQVLGPPGQGYSRLSVQTGRVCKCLVPAKQKVLAVSGRMRLRLVTDYWHWQWLCQGLAVNYFPRTYPSVPLPWVGFIDYGKMLCKRWAYQPGWRCPRSSEHWTSICKS